MQDPLGEPPVSSEQAPTPHRTPALAIEQDRTQISVRQEKAVLAAVHLPGSRFDPRDPLGELRALAETAGATVRGEIIQRRHKPASATYMGPGKVEELRAMCDELDATLVIYDHELSPKQLANIEKVIERKVIDRSELILDIFAARATTHAAKLQVELAQLEYTYPRLRAMWDHLERIVGTGGIGGIGTRGPGEQQLEIDRRIVQRKRTQLRRELEEIQARKTREVRDRNRDHVTVGLVGYTNAGKSTLFNTLTAGGAHANDQLFATLMARTREWNIGGGMRVMLSDTVGFVRDLPHNLIASFRATLEEATHADVLLILLDVSDPSADLQYETVQETLDGLFEETRQAAAREGIDWHEPTRMLLLNKADKLRDNAELLVWTQRDPAAIPLCALRPDALGHDTLIQHIRTAARGDVREMHLTLSLRDAKVIDTIEKQATVVDRQYTGDEVTLRVRLGDRQLARLRARGAHIHAEDVETPSTFSDVER